MIRLTLLHLDKPAERYHRHDEDQIDDTGNVDSSLEIEQTSDMYESSLTFDGSDGRKLFLG